MSQPTGSPIIIVKKKKGHGGHHGGAWKVAYADFVTAMMALFIVLWLLNSSQKVQKTVGGYFRDPKGLGKMAGNTKSGSGEGMTIKQEDMQNLKKRIEAVMRKEIQNFDKMKEFLEITVTDEGLRVELMESDKGTFFDSGKALPTSLGKDVLGELSGQLAKLKNTVVIEGHTDAKSYSSDEGYSNWELSADRANAARRLMREKGLRPDQITQVRGFADQRLRTPEDPENPRNRRISVIIRFEEDLPTKETEPKKEAAPASGHG